MKRLLLILAISITLTVTANGQSRTGFCKKWYLEGYIYWGVTLSPDDIEKNDFIHLKTDNTFSSIDEGQFEKGTWKWNPKNKTIYLYNESSKEPLSLKLVELSNSLLIVILEDEEDSIKVKFKAK